MMRCGQETTTVPMRRNGGTCCHDQKLPSLDLRRTMPGKESKEERTFKGLDCATPDPHLRSDYTLTGMRAGCCTSDWKRGFRARLWGLASAWGQRDTCFAGTRLRFASLVHAKPIGRVGAAMRLGKFDHRFVMQSGHAFPQAELTQ